MSKYRVEFVRYVPELFVCYVEATDTHAAIRLTKMGAKAEKPGTILEQFDTQPQTSLPIKINLASVSIKKQV